MHYLAIAVIAFLSLFGAAALAACIAAWRASRCTGAGVYSVSRFHLFCDRSSSTDFPGEAYEMPVITIERHDPEN